MTIGENIRRLRLEKGMTQKELGKLTGMADSAIRRYESDRANPKIETLSKIANALEVSISSLQDYSNLDYSDAFRKDLSKYDEIRIKNETRTITHEKIFEIIQLMGYNIRFYGCLEIKDGHIYDDSAEGFIIDGESHKTCTYSNELCRDCKLRKNTYYEITRTGEGFTDLVVSGNNMDIKADDLRQSFFDLSLLISKVPIKIPCNIMDSFLEYESQKIEFDFMNVLQSYIQKNK